MEEALMPVYQEYLGLRILKSYNNYSYFVFPKTVHDCLTWSALLMHINLHRRPLMQRYSATTQDYPSKCFFYSVQLNRNSLDTLASVLCSASPSSVTVPLTSQNYPCPVNFFYRPNQIMLGTLHPVSSEDYKWFWGLISNPGLKP